jgi:hypothetical protein
MNYILLARSRARIRPSQYLFTAGVTTQFRMRETNTAESISLTRVSGHSTDAVRESNPAWTESL